MAEDVFRYLLGLVGSAAAADAIIKSMTAASRPPQTILNLRERFSDPEYTVVVQPPTGPKGPQPMVVNRYGDWIVDPYGTIQNPAACPPGQSCVGQKTQTAGIQEAINYLANTSQGGKILIRSGTYNASAPITIGFGYWDIEGEGKVEINAPYFGASLSPYSSLPSDYYFDIPLPPEPFLKMKRLTLKPYGNNNPSFSIQGLNPYSPPSNLLPQVNLGTVVLDNVDIVQMTSGADDIMQAVRLHNLVIRNSKFINYYFWQNLSQSGCFALMLEGNDNVIVEDFTGINWCAGINVYSDNPNGNYIFRNIFVMSVANNNGVNAGPIAFYPTGSAPEYTNFEIENAVIVAVGEASGAPTAGGNGFINIQAWSPGNVSIKNVVVSQLYSQYPLVGVNIAANQGNGQVEIENLQSQGFTFYTGSGTQVNTNPVPTLLGIQIGSQSALQTVKARNLRTNFNSNTPVYPVLVFGIYGNGINAAVAPFDWDIDGVAVTYSGSSPPAPYLVQLQRQESNNGQVTIPPGSMIKISGSIGKRKYIITPNLIESLLLSSVTVNLIQLSGALNFTDSLYYLYDNSTPSTPSVPSSGSAVMNLNPYPVLVYIYGGTVTQVQVTRDGTTYTVFSNSSGASLPGVPVYLDPGDSITISYSSAPTWVWAPAYD